MSVNLTIGSETFQYPDAGTKAGWGEAATSWAVAVTNKLATLSGTNDINFTCVSIVNNQSTPANVGTGASALKFPIASVRSFVVTYAVTRTDTCCVVTAESGQIEGVYDGSNWALNNSLIGCAGMAFEITAAGQIQYYTDATKGAGAIKFRARTIDN